ncbi:MULTISPECIES: type II toxin-antitoxin system VapC family toxin [unclassified Mesorhizobium]|uniref:type II toxin-antitoxin system VapC family toxin n=1 Tax=unclassified Mesorhizobium TaxID=325217 RepID=UPI001FDFD774|nr:MULTISPECIES: type II toxin-antitoxin system VapC family toxin [unclassified Mesorhizobium]
MRQEAMVTLRRPMAPGGLNFGDCIAYATARLEAMPLLFKGDNLRLTDIETAV